MFKKSALSVTDAKLFLISAIIVLYVIWKVNRVAYTSYTLIQACPITLRLVNVAAGADESAAAYNRPTVR